MRKFIFQNEKFYHIFNRGVDKRKIFLGESDYIRFLEGMWEFNTIESIDSLYRLRQLREKESVATRLLYSSRVATDSARLVDFIAYCLNPNHFHFILKQKKEDGVSKFMHKVGSGYTHYFNHKNNRSGSLFQGKFKAVEVKSDHQLRYVSAYINGNPEIHKIEKAKNWKWSSYLDYLGKRNGVLCDKKYVLEYFKNLKEYDDYTNNVIKESGEIKEEMKKIVFDN